jgi:hypothetical protein
MSTDAAKPAYAAKIASIAEVVKCFMRVPRFYESSKKVEPTAALVHAGRRSGPLPGGRGFVGRSSA